MITRLLNAKSTGEYITKQISSCACNDFRFAVAYARDSGAKIVAPHIEKLLSREGFVEGFVGVNQGNTSYQALCRLHDVMGGHLHVRYAKKITPTFHSKIYIWGESQKKIWQPSSILVGSSNLSRGGLDTNEECNCLIEKDCNPKKLDPDDAFFESACEIWESTTKSQGNFSNFQVSKEDLYKLLQTGALIDETKQQKKSQTSIDKIIEGVDVVVQEAMKPKHDCFGMYLTHFDTSSRSAEPVILVPLTARAEDPEFWFWPFLFSRGNEMFEKYRIDANVFLNGGHQVKENLLLYDYPGKSEFRLRSEIIRQNGKERDILLVHRDGENISLHLIRQTDKRYKEYESYLTKKASPKKRWGYFPYKRNIDKSA